MKPEPIDLQNIGKVYHNENEAVCNERKKSLLQTG